MVLGTYSCQILSSLWFFTGWIDGFLKFLRASWTHAHWVIESFWSDFTPGWQILEASPMWKHIRSSSRAFLAKRAAGFSLSLLPNNTDRLLSSISSGNKYSLISPQTHDAFFHFLCPLHKMEKWRWEAVAAPSLKKKYVQDHHSSFWELLAHLRH